MKSVGPGGLHRHFCQQTRATASEPLPEKVGRIKERFLQIATQGRVMSYVRLLGFSTMSCGCVVGHYREIASGREVTYVEQKGSTCDYHQHRRNHTIRPATLSSDRSRTTDARAF